MKVSQQLINKLKEFEGFRANAYKAVESEEYWTIGYGHYGPDVNPSDIWSKEYAEEMLKKDLQKFESHVNSTFSGLDQHQFDALVDFCYNCGFRTSSTLYKRVKSNKNDIRIKDAFMMWNKSGGKTLSGLTKRRKWEANWYFATTPTSDIEDSLAENKKQEKDSSNVISNTLGFSALASTTSESIKYDKLNYTGSSTSSMSLPPKIIQGKTSEIILDELSSKA